MNDRKTGMEKIERALTAAYLQRGEAAEAREREERAVARIMAGVRAAARERRAGWPGDTRFLWRFVSTGAVAAAALVLVAISNLPQDTGTANAAADDMVVAVLNPTMPF